MEVKVYQEGLEKAIKILKRKMAKEGIFRELRRQQAYEKPSVKKRRKRQDARKRRLKAERRGTR